MHVQQVPGMRFLAYNELFSVTKGADETLPAVALQVEDTLTRVKELRPVNVKLAVGTRPYGLDDLDNELALMAMLCALPQEEYGDLTSSLMRQKDLTRADGPSPAPRAPAPVPAPTPADDAPEPAGPRRSARSNAGVAPPSNWYNATARMRSQVRGVPVVSYRETGTRSSSRGRARAPALSREPSAGPSSLAPPMPNAEEEEEAALEAPREPPVDDDDDDDLYA
jgi:hypothetical protein